ncbi:MAG: DUF1631 family protein [Rhodoferax sp.]
MSHRIGWRHLGVAQDPSTHVPSLQECLQAVLERSDGLVDELLGALQAAAGGSGARVGHTALDTQGQALAQTLCQQHTQFRQRFAQTLEQALYHGIGDSGPGPAPIGEGDLRWLDVEQVDTHIESALAEHEVQSAVQDVLAQVHACMAALMGWQSVQPDLHPLRPQVFVHALRQAMAQVLGPGQQHRAVTIQAATVLGTGLRQLYRELLQWLLSAGVEPAPSAVGATSTLAGGDPALGARARRTQLTLDKLRRLLQADDAALAGGPPEFSQTVPAAYQALEDLQLLDPLMQRLAQRARPAVSTLESAPEPGDAPPPQLPQRRLGRQLGQEVAALMLERCVQDPRLLPAMRRSLHALQPVLLRLARHDARFFSEPAHPARRYLECITQRSLLYRDEQHPELQRLLRDLERARRALRHGAGDADAFAQTLQGLQADWARREATQRARAEAARRALAQAQQRQAWGEHWAQVVGERLSRANDCPAMVAAFVLGPWVQVLVQAQMQGASEEQLQALACAADELAWSSSAQRGPRDRARLLRLIPAMLATLRQGLALIDHPPAQMAAFFDGLITHHERVFDTRDLESITLPSDPDPDLHAPEGPAHSTHPHLAQDVPTPPEGAVPSLPAPPLPWSAASLPTGAWVDLVVAERWVRAQLVWSSPRRTLFMFISGGGLAHTLSRRTLERRRLQGLVRWASDGPLPDPSAPAGDPATVAQAL